MAEVTWQVHRKECGPNEGASHQITLVRDNSRTSVHHNPVTRPSCSGADKSILEQNGLHATVRVCFSSSGICTAHSTVLFPTRLTAPKHPRAYLQVPFSTDGLPSMPAETSYDGTTLKFSYNSTSGPTLVSIFVSPSLPTAWAILEFSEEQTLDTPSLQDQLVAEEGGHRVWVKRQWTSTKRLQIAYTCVRDLAPYTALSDMTQRRQLVKTWTSSIRVECPDPDINAALHFANIRVCEAIFDAPNLGRVHSPGGGMFYSGVWCNDQAEYAAPVLAMMGGNDSAVQTAAVNSLRALANSFDPEGHFIPYSVEVDGGYLGRLDRGDAGMFAWGASLVALTIASDEVTNEFYPHIRFACQTITRKIAKSGHGIVTSQSDELEGRFPTGDANLAVNCISILALESAAEVSLAVNAPSESKEYASAAANLRQNVDCFFGVEHRRRYQYFDGCHPARGWACLAALARLKHGKEAVDFTLNDLWVDDGVLTAEGKQDVWDRCSLYAIRAAFVAGLVDTATDRLARLARRRLGQGVSAPFMVENNCEWAQLSAESGLFIRTFTEGLLGIRVKHSKSMQLQPRCPDAWPCYSLNGLRFCSTVLNFKVENTSPCKTLSVQSKSCYVSKGFPPGSVLVLYVADNGNNFTLEVV